MLLLEHHGKELALAAGAPIPAGVFVASLGALDESALPDLPCIVKAQVRAGGRGKAGGVIKVGTPAERRAAIERLQTFTHRGEASVGVRVEACLDARAEVYFSMSVDPTAAGVHLIMSADGGVEIENAAPEALLKAACALDQGQMVDAARRLAARLPGQLGMPVTAVLSSLVQLFFDAEALMLEFNPLLVLQDGSCVVGDVRLSIDENAVARRPALLAIIEANPIAYPEAAFKVRHGFDYVELDAQGEIGLLTTGAGLSMILVDDMRRMGMRPINFCDVRSGLLRGSPQRLIDVLRAVSQSPRLRAVFVSIFAGVTDLAEFAELLSQARRAMPEFDAPIVARLVGHNFEAARSRLAELEPDMIVEPDLPRALEELARKVAHAR